MSISHLGETGHDYTRPMALMVIAMLVLPGIDGIAKWLAASLSAGVVCWSRFAFQALFMLPAVLRLRGRLFRGPMGVHALRGVLLVVTTLLFFSALRFLPIADAISIFFVEPLVLTLLSALFLGERIGWRRVSAILVGFLGAMLIIRPSFGVFGWVSVLPLFAALCFACYLIVTRSQSQREEPVRMQFYSGVFGCAAISLAVLAGDRAGIAVFAITAPSAFEWLLMASLGIIATGGHLLVVMAFRRVPAGVLAPFQYLEIVSATLLGLFVFGDFPDGLTWMGIAIIVGSGLYVFHRERVRAAEDGPS